MLSFRIQITLPPDSMVNMLMHGFYEYVELPTVRVCSKSNLNVSVSCYRVRRLLDLWKKNFASNHQIKVIDRVRLLPASKMVKNKSTDPHPPWSLDFILKKGSLELPMKFLFHFKKRFPRTPLKFGFNFKKRFPRTPSEIGKMAAGFISCCFLLIKNENLLKYTF